MSEETVNTVVADDEMPMAPATDGSTEGAPEVEIDGTMDGAVVQQAMDVGEPVPAGTYHCVLESYEKASTPNEDGLGPNPYFKCKFTIKDPRFLGRVFFDNITWVRPIDLKKAQMGDPTSQQTCKNRLGKIKSLQNACNWKPQGNYNVMVDFLDKKPECKAQLGVKPRMSKNEKGEYKIPTGQVDNTVIKYVQLLRSA